MFSRVLTDQITHLKVEIEGGIIVKLPNGNKSNLFALILSLGKCLKNLTISQLLSGRSLTDPTFYLASVHHVSLTLTKLKINVNTFDDCLYILDGHLQCLSTLIIDILKILDSTSNIDKTVSIISIFSLWLNQTFNNLFAVQVLRRQN